MPSNEHHELIKERDWPAVYGPMCHPDRDLDLLRRKYKERDEHGRLPHHWMAAKAQTHTHMLAMVGVQSICWNLQGCKNRLLEEGRPQNVAQLVTSDLQVATDLTCLFCLLLAIVLDHCNHHHRILTSFSTCLR